METDDSPAPDSNQSEVEALRDQTSRMKIELKAAQAKVNELDQKLSLSSFGVQWFHKWPYYDNILSWFQNCC